MNTASLTTETTDELDDWDALLEESIEPDDQANDEITPEKTPDAEPAPTAEAEPASSAADHKINGLLNELRHTREELKALRAQQQQLTAQASVRDFSSEKAQLQKQWEDGELDSDAYQERREALILEQAQHLAAAQFQQLQQQQQQQVQAQTWQQVIGPWQEKHADFLANPIRRNAVNELISSLDSDPHTRLSDQALLEKVEAAPLKPLTGNPKTHPQRR